MVKIGEFECTECWDGVFYKKLANYPVITEWEIQTVLDFEHYEKQNGRDCFIEADYNILKAIDEYKKTYESGKCVNVPKKITECVACPKYKGSMTDYVCHTSPVENAVNIFKCGSLQAPTRWRGVSASVLKVEGRNAANDPEDYFDYVMFAWGNCQAGDRLVMERKMRRFPTEADLSIDFTPGVRFFFKYDKIVTHPDAVDLVHDISMVTFPFLDSGYRFLFFSHNKRPPVIFLFYLKRPYPYRTIWFYRLFSQTLFSLFHPMPVKDYSLFSAKCGICL